ncbi:MAG: hypothetical protein HY925_10470 [Elusimicrobia bacterium]|nr:hypothetical protein [Elusimicrobiota bacterium]
MRVLAVLLSLAASAQTVKTPAAPVPVSGSPSISLPASAIGSLSISPAASLASTPGERVLRTVAVAGEKLPAAKGVPLAGRLVERIEENEFEVYRPLEEYLTLLGADFARRLAALSGHWIDAGAGEAKAAIHFLWEDELKIHGSYARHDSRMWKMIFDSDRKRSADELAIVDVLEKRLSYQGAPAALSAPFGRKPFVTAVSKTADALNMPRQPSGGKFRFLRGKFFRDIPVKDLLGRGGPAELITDVFGVFAYDPRPDLVLKRYTDLLADDGEIYILLGIDSDPLRLSQHRVRSGRKEIGLVDWVKGIPGLEVEEQANKNFGLPVSRVLRIKKTGGAIRIPSLELVDVVDTKGSKKLNPPLRIFVD